MTNQFWSQSVVDKIDLDHVRNIYTKELKNLIGKSKKISDLEISHYFENYLWANFKYEEHQNNINYLMSIILMINEKFRENIDVWELFKEDKQKFSYFFTSICKISLLNDLTIIEKINILIFFIKVFGSLEIDLIRQELSKFISPSIWLNLSEKRRLKEIEKLPKLKKYFRQLDVKDSKLNSDELKNVNFERSFLVNYVNSFLEFLNQIPSCDKEFKHQDKKFILIYCERFIEFLIDLESVSPIRRFLNVILDEKHVFVILKNSNLSQRKEGKLFNQMLDILKFYIRFEVNSETNEELSVEEISINHYKKIANLQKLVFKELVKYKEFYLNTVSQIDNNEKLIEFFKSLPLEDLKRLAIILDFYDETTFNNYDRELVEKVLVFHFQKYVSQIETINELSLYPTEDIIWDENIVPSQYYNSENCLAIPKLNLQFLTLQDYLSKNIHLFRLESTFEIRQDIEKAIFHMKPWINDRDQFIYGGVSRMAMNIDSFSIIEIKAPKIGEKSPSRIRAEVKVLLNVKDQFKKEWESLRKHDVCFLITLKPKLKYKTKFNFKESFLDQVELLYVRGCELEGMLDNQGKLVDENSKETLEFDNNYRTYRVFLDPNQYYEDTINQKEELYDSFNIIVRRKPKENNFKAVLETIKDLINTKFIVPDWLHDLLLGYGHPSSAHYSELLNNIDKFNFNDTFIDLQHLKDSFPDSQINFVNNQQNLLPPYVLKFEDTDKKVIHVSNPIEEDHLFPENKLKINKIRFTSTQVEAIYSGMQNGLTLIVGPPGTGKTDVAVQIISNIYQNFPNQRTLIVTHSNQALNQLFEKIMCLNIDEKHLLRLGHGEEELETEKDFSRYGRVNYVLGKRLLLLYEVGRLAKTLNVNLDAGCSCETAAYFYLYHVLSKYEEFVDLIYKSDKTTESFEQLFPFQKYFEQENQKIFTGTTFEQNISIANYYFRKLKKIFTEIEEFRAFEILRSNLERSNFLLIKEAKIIAMTCTHAALKRRQLVELGFQYDNILMEEAAQILEIETFIPLLLQNPEHGHNRLKRWIMIGDHNQLPPIIKNTAFQKYGNMEQSLFKRFIRLGVPAINLDAQGRSRPTLCSLFKWRYKVLNDLEHVKNVESYLKANSGFVYEYQFINVDDFEGVGETEPIPYFYQNETEAEFVILQFIYMRLIGYPAEKITILTTYNGQKQKIKEVLNDRLGKNEFFGQPSKITTVDKYQGMQNDYIILSLVRTKAVGHLRDIRRLVVAMSRARLGLYIFGKFNLFKNCLELHNVFSILNQRPTELHLFINEDYLTNRDLNDHKNGNLKVIKNLKEMTDFVLGFYPEKLEYWKKVNPDYIEKIVKKNNEEENKSNDEEEYESNDEEENKSKDVELEENKSDNENLNDAENISDENNLDNQIMNNESDVNEKKNDPENIE